MPYHRYMAAWRAPHATRCPLCTCCTDSAPLCSLCSLCTLCTLCTICTLCTLCTLCTPQLFLRPLHQIPAHPGTTCILPRSSRHTPRHTAAQPAGAARFSREHHPLPHHHQRALARHRRACGYARHPIRHAGQERRPLRPRDLPAPRRPHGALRPARCDR